MKKGLAILSALCVLAAALFTGCRIQSVEEHDASIAASYYSQQTDAGTESGSQTSAPSDDAKSKSSKQTDSEDRDSEGIGTSSDSGKNSAGSALTQKKSGASSQSETTKSSSKSSGTTASAKAKTTSKAVTSATAAESEYINVTVSINSSAAAGLSSALPSGTYSARVKKGSSVFAATKAAFDAAGISLGYTSSVYSTYVSSIGGLSEKVSKDYPYSGWKYAVNGVYPNVSCAGKTVSDADRISWVYVLNYK